jgi:hypothetical protein
MRWPRTRVSERVLLALAGFVLAGLVLTLGQIAMAPTPFLGFAAASVAARPLGVAQPSDAGDQRLTDADGALTLRVPAGWSDTESARWTYGGRDVGVYVAAAPNLGAFYRMEGPGVFVGASEPLAQSHGVAGLLAAEQALHAGRCRHDGPIPYADAFYQGSHDAFTACVGGHDRLVTAALGQGGRHVVLVRAVVASEADRAAAARVFASVQVRGQLDGHHDD